MYERPRTAFVADFLGSTNLIKIDGLEKRPGETMVRLFGEVFHLPTGTEQVTGMISIRPEAITLRPWSDREGPRTQAGVVRRVTYLGVWAEYTVEIGGQSVMARELVRPGAPLRQVDERVRLTVDSQAIHPVVES